MGYSVTVPYAYFEISNVPQPSITCTTTKTSRALKLINIPFFSKRPDYAYMDVIFSGRFDTSAATNYLQGSPSPASTLQIENSAGTAKYDAGSLYDVSFSTPASTTVYGSTKWVGNVNIAPYIEPNAVQIPYINVVTHGNNLVLYDVYAVIRLYFNIV